MSFETIKLEAATENIQVLKISRPQALNALNMQVMKELENCLDQLHANPPRVLIVTGDGDKSFVAGADIREMEKMSSVEAFEMSRRGQRVFQKLESLPCATMAVVNGFALGGGLELALSCDILLASDKCKWGLPEVTLGLIPGYGGTQRLARHLGMSTAQRITLSGEMFTAEQGEKWGLFTHIFVGAELMASAMRIAKTISERAPKAVAWAKQSIQKSKNFVDDGFRLEADLFSKAFSTQDKTEGVSAFIEKRTAHFSGK